MAQEKAAPAPASQQVKSWLGAQPVYSFLGLAFLMVLDVHTWSSL